MRKRLDEASWGRFAERLARLLDGGVPLLEALSFLQSRGKGKERVLTTLTLQRLQQGRLLSHALLVEEAPLIIRTLVEVGEHNGDLAGSLFRSSAYCVERAKWRKEYRQALIYPYVVVVVLLFVSLFLFQVVIPRFADLYAGMGLKMAEGTRFLIAFAPIAPRLLVVGMGVGIAGWLCWRYLGKPLDRIRVLCQRLPVIRQWALLERTHEWASTLGLLLDGGLPLVQALDVQSQLPLRHRNRDICQRVRERVVQGISLGDALQQEELDDRLLLSVQVAEVTGDLSRALLTVERELATARKAMMTSLFKALEPVLILLAGALVGVVALFMLWPMLDLLNTI